MKKNIVALALSALLIYFYVSRSQEIEPIAATADETLPPQNTEADEKEKVIAPPPAAPAPAPPPAPAAFIQPVGTPVKAQKSGTPILSYVIEDGVVVVQGDIVVGRPATDDVPEKGLVEMPRMKLWTSGTIPMAIHKDVSAPDRINAAMEMFSETSVRFVPYTDQQDVLVFQEGTGNCKSYVGRIGGAQPIWISPRCGPAEIAHEILHALGFVHEQNRADRDAFILVNFDSIQEAEHLNFEKLPDEFMAVSGLTPFDFKSLMIYPIWMFAKGGQPTMQTVKGVDEIAPSDRLSELDAERVNRAYRN